MKADHEQEFLEAYDTYADAIYRHCFFRVFRKERAEELTQDVFLKTWHYLQEGNRIDNMKAFLYRVANNMIIDEVRKKKEESLDAALDVRPEIEPYDDGNDMETRVLLTTVRAEMERLPEEDRKILIMRYVDDLEPREIADVLGMTANHVSVKINRAIQKLKVEFNT